MTIRNRSAVMVALLVSASILYGMANYYSSSLVLYVVEQTLIQKAPEGSNPVLLRKRLHDLLASIPAKNEKMSRLLQISKQLEKVQSLRPADLNNLLAFERRQ